MWPILQLHSNGHLHPLEKWLSSGKHRLSCYLAHTPTAYEVEWINDKLNKKAEVQPLSAHLGTWQPPKTFLRYCSGLVLSAISVSIPSLLLYHTIFMCFILAAWNSNTIKSPTAHVPAQLEVTPVDRTNRPKLAGRKKERKKQKTQHTFTGAAWLQIKSRNKNLLFQICLEWLWNMVLSLTLVFGECKLTISLC